MIRYTKRNGPRVLDGFSVFVLEVHFGDCEKFIYFVNPSTRWAIREYKDTLKWHYKVVVPCLNYVNGDDFNIDYLCDDHDLEEFYISKNNEVYGSHNV